MNGNKFKIGSQIAVLDDNIRGVVTSVEKFVITIEDEDGFLRHFQPKELVLIDTKNVLHNLDFKLASKHKSVKKTKKRVNKLLLEVDLHIHNITYSNKNMSNFDMLSRQLDFAEQKLKLAIKNKIQQVVFIHGVGQGKLKTELHNLLKKYPVQIQDASFKKYGYGATEVYIFKTKV